MPASKDTFNDTRLKVFAWLNTTRYAASSLEPLIGGQANFTYHAKLLAPLEDGTAEVVVKHGEPYMARHPANAITTQRCRVEAECLTELKSAQVHLDQPGAVNYNAGTPICYHYDDDTKTQIQEYLPSTIDLKMYLRSHFLSQTPQILESPCRNVGKILAEHISGFHAASTKPLAALRSNGQMQALKHKINYDWLLQRVDQFPEILSEARDIFAQVKQQALTELGDASALKAIHGDFCPQNILLLDAPLESQSEISLFVVDWENGQLGVESLDHGEMIGEVYALWLSNKMDAALWVVQGYSDGLGPRPTDFVWRLIVQVGVHLLSFDTLAGTQAQAEDVARYGRDIIVNAWKKNRAWFEGSDLACLFAGVEEEEISRTLH
ncbi:hypothetical protein ACHAPT_008917 [Fusarium lateritium]